MFDLEKAKEKMIEFDSNRTVNNFRHISYEEKIARSMDELLGTNSESIIKWGWNIWDNILGGIYGGKVYVLGGDSGSGKSSFVNQIAFNLTKQKIKLTKYSLEDRLEDAGKEELFYICNRFRASKGLPLYSWIKFVNNEYSTEGNKNYDSTFKTYLQEAFLYLKDLNITELDKKRQVKISDLVTLMEEEAISGTKVFLIDHLHYFKMGGDSRTDLEIQNIMHEINEIARKYNVAIFLVAHYKKLNGTDPNNDSFKDASAIKQVANIIIHIIRRDTGYTHFKIDKIRGPISKTTIEGKFCLDTFTYNEFLDIGTGI